MQRKGSRPADRLAQPSGCIASIADVSGDAVVRDATGADGAPLAFVGRGPLYARKHSARHDEVMRACPGDIIILIISH